jgi:hypothetical protein
VQFHHLLNKSECTCLRGSPAAYKPRVQQPATLINTPLWRELSKIQFTKTPTTLTFTTFNKDESHNKRNVLTSKVVY